VAIERVFPTELDVGGDGDGRVMTEANLAAFKNAGARNIHVTSGDTYETSARSFVVQGLSPTNGGSLTLNISSGKAIIEGFYVNNDATVGITLPDGAQREIYLKLDYIITQVSGASFVASDTTDGVLANAILIANVTTAGGVITTIDDERRFTPSVIAGTYAGNDASNRDIDIAANPLLVMVSAEDYSIVAMSAVSAPRERSFNSPDNKGGWYFTDQSGQALQHATDGIVNTKTWDPPQLADGVGTSTTITVTGAVVGDLVLASLTTLPGTAGLALQGVVTSSNTVTVWIHNATGSTVDVSSGTLNVMVKDWSARRTFQAADGRWSSATDGKQIPLIVKHGFRVSHDTATNLNDSSKTYHYVAFL
jgi:hypothetical protein